MREDIMFDNQSKPCKYATTNQNSNLNTKNDSKPKFGSSWGSQIVRGFVSDKKTKNQAKKPPIVPYNENPNSNSNPNSASSNKSVQNIPISYQSRVKRSLIGDFPCNVNTSQVHPQGYDCNLLRSPASREIFVELDHLREQVRESKERELALQCEILQLRESPKVSELEREVETKKGEIERLSCKVKSLEGEKSCLSEQVSNLNSIVRKEGRNFGEKIGDNNSKNLEVEVLELRRVNKELQFQKRNLMIKLSLAESKLEGAVKNTESDILAKIQEEASLLRNQNANLSKQIEGLQMSRLTEVEELAYLRWINSCLRHELNSSDKIPNETLDLDEETLMIPNLEDSDDSDLLKDGKVKNLNLEGILDKEWTEPQNPTRRHSISGLNESNGSEEESETNVINTRRQSDNFFTASKEFFSRNESAVFQTEFENLPQISRLPKAESCIEKRALRVPNPPPRPSVSSSCSGDPNGSNELNETNKLNELKETNGSNGSVLKSLPPVPPPPPPRKPSSNKPCSSNSNGLNGSNPSKMLNEPTPSNGSNMPNVVNVPNGSKSCPPIPPPLPKFPKTGSGGIMQRAPQVAELYHSLMRRDSRRDSCGGAVCEGSNSGGDSANMRSSMIGEIENRSSHLLAIKADVETQGEFVNSLIKEVNNAIYNNIEDVVAFVKWLDDELCFLVDERAVLKHFDWPEKKADMLREAAFEYRDLKKLENEVSDYIDDHRLPRDLALKKMVSLSERIERTVYNLLRTRDATIRQCKEYNIPTDWILDSGLISKIKFASVKLAKKYMKRVANELQLMGTFNKDPALEYMLLQGVRFAFRIHQFAGGFDAETMDAFEELRNLAYVSNNT